MFELSVVFDPKAAESEPTSKESIQPEVKSEPVTIPKTEPQDSFEAGKVDEVRVSKSLLNPYTFWLNFHFFLTKFLHENLVDTLQKVEIKQEFVEEDQQTIMMRTIIENNELNQTNQGSYFKFVVSFFDQFFVRKF